MPNSAPDLGAKPVMDRYAFRLALGNAISREITEAKIAERLETSVQSVRRWREGKQLPHPHYCDAIVAVLNKM